MTPFGFEVLPDVNCRKQRSSGSTAGGSNARFDCEAVLLRSLLQPVTAQFAVPQDMPAVEFVRVRPLRRSRDVFHRFVGQGPGLFGATDAGQYERDHGTRNRHVARHLWLLLAPRRQNLASQVLGFFMTVRLVEDVDCQDELRP